MILWLASYPKSGNTLLRSILATYFFSEDGIFNFNHLYKIGQFPSLIHFENLGIDTTDSEQIYSNIIKAQEIINSSSKQLKFFKTHNAMCKVGPYQFTSKKNTKGAIYLIRDPRDVLVSLSHHMGLDYEKTFKHMSSSYNYEYPSSGSKRYKKSLMGSWSDHYKSWKNFKSCKILIIKYEDMILDELNTFKKIINYLNKIDNTNFDDEKLKKALKQTQFKELQKIEKNEGFSEKGQGEFFFRKGKIGVWKDEVSNDIIKQIEKLFGKEMSELGYL